MRGVIVLNLKKIELHGFKSFADKTEIPFESNVTGIVGPNGCGKSNVIDAVRWVLGEQAPKTLRVTKMPDLIFNGTTNRLSLSYCEVSLYLDNEDRRYNVDFDEVVITRKLVRGGEGEYFINRQRCRHKDIIDLFRDTGIGREGYSIIGQGKIDEILSNSPEGRRKIFEEAAGISRQKARKVETERKLERARLDMSRINDILQEVGASLGPLEKEASDACKVKALREKLKYLEVAYFLYQCDNSADTRDRIRAKLKKINDDLSLQTTELDRLNHDYNVTMMGIENGTKYSNMIRDQITELLVAAEKAQGDGRALGKDIDYINQDNFNISEGRKINKVKLEEKAKLIEEKFNLSVEKSKELSLKEIESEEVTKEYNKISYSVEQQEKTLELSNEMFVDRLSKNAEIDKDVAALELERKLLVDGLSTDREEYEDKKSLSSKVSKLRDNFVNEKASLEKEKSEKVQELSLANENKSNAENEFKEMQQRKTFLQQRVQNYEFKKSVIEENINSYNDYDGSIQNLMSYAKDHPEVEDKIIATVAEIITVPKDLQVAIEIALGKSIQNIITKNEYDASDLMKVLRNNNLGRATFLPMTTIKYNDLPREYERALDEDGVVGVASELIRYDSKYANIISNLLGRTVIVEDQDTAIRVSKKYGYSFRSITLEGDLYSPSGALTGGSVSKGTARILSRENEKEDIIKKIRQAKKDLELISADIKDREEELKELTSAVSVISSRIAKLDIEITKVEGDISKCDRELDFYQSEMKKLFAGNEGSLQRLEEIEKLLKEAGKNKESISSDKTTSDDYINDLRNKLFEDRQQREILNKQVTAVMMEVTALKNEVESLEKEIVGLKAECKIIEQELLDFDVREKYNNGRLERLKKDLETLVSNSKEQAQIDELKKQLNELEEEKDRMNALVKELDQKRIEQNDLVNKTKEKAIREEANLEMVDTQIAAMSQRMEENYGYDLDMSKAYFETVDPSSIDVEFVPDKANTEINSIRRKIERFGPINELAEEKFREESDRYNDLNNQFNDVQKAEQDLVQIINELTAEMVEKFTASFNIINENFNEVFKELFGGGRAKMELEKGVNVLEAGIEIMAEPPGKKLSNLAPLSGGERALTAIAILFAIIKLNPMPFSILDEIEAALDETNARLFAQYLNKFSKHTQFIVVTHRKPTMQLCNTLFGVTMQEKGVSKTVRVKLEEAEKHAEIKKNKDDQPKQEAN